MRQATDIDGQLPTAYLLGWWVFVGLPATQIVTLTLKVRPLCQLPFTYEAVRRMCEDDILLYLVPNLIAPVRQSTKLPWAVWPKTIQDAITLVNIVRRLTLSETVHIDADVQRAGKALTNVSRRSRKPTNIPFWRQNTVVEATRLFQRSDVRVVRSEILPV